MLVVDAFFRFSGVGLLLLLAIAAARSLRDIDGARYLILASLSVTGLFLGYTIDAFRLPGPVHVAARLLDVPHLIFVWLLTLSLFQKDFSVRAWHVAVGVAYCLPIIAARVAGFGIGPAFPHWAVVVVDVMAFGIAAHLITTILIERPDDLVQNRRSARVNFALMVAFVVISAAAIELLLTGNLRAYLPTAKVMTIWPAIVWGCLWMMVGRREAFAFVRDENPNPAIVKLDQPLYEALITEIVENKAYLEPSMTIAALSKRLGVTQHRLRDLINQGMGYKNFSAFINKWRIEAVKKELAAHPERPILTIAMDNGFNSLSPFNRAFREQEGMTPTAYRSEVAER